MIKLDDYQRGYAVNHSIFQNSDESKITDFYNYYSQNGEDGVLEKIFDVLNIKMGVFVNGGCDDIYDHSNVRRLVSKYNWNGLFIEPDNKLLSAGKDNLDSDSRIVNGDFYFHNSFLSVNNDNESITNVINQYYSDSTEFDLLTLHIDSYEYWVLEDFLNGKHDSKVILVGYNFSRADSVTATKDCSPKIGHQSITDNFFSASAPALNKLARKHGYGLVSICKPNNLIFVKESLNNNQFQIYEPLNEEDFYWSGDSFTNNRRKKIKEGWIEI